jgi:hypothetical protein
MRLEVPDPTKTLPERTVTVETNVRIVGHAPGDSPDSPDSLRFTPIHPGAERETFRRRSFRKELAPAVADSEIRAARTVAGYSAASGAAGVYARIGGILRNISRRIHPTCNVATGDSLDAARTLLNCFHHVSPEKTAQELSGQA